MRTIMLAGWMLIGCNAHTDAPPAAPPVERIIALRDFTAVEATGPDDIDIRGGSDFAIRVHADPAILERLEIRRDGDVLRIGRKPGDWSRRAGKATIRVTMPVLHAATLTGSGDIAIDRADDLAATLTGSGDITIGQLRGTTARLALTGSGTIAAAGAVDRLAMSVAGSGDIDARQVKAAAADVSIAGSGDATADVTGPARVALTGSGSATLGSGAHCTVTRVGSGQARCGT